MSEIKLTPDEERLILQHRAIEEQDRKDRALALRRLKVAFDFAQWMEIEGCGSSYSTFCDDFGYEATEDENRSRTYEIVTDIIKLAKRVW